MTTITIPKKLIKDDLIVIDKRIFEKISKENTELRLAIKAIIEGERALLLGKTRSFNDFLKTKIRKHAKNR